MKKTKLIWQVILSMVPEVSKWASLLELGAFSLMSALMAMRMLIWNKVDITQIQEAWGSVLRLKAWKKLNK